MQPIAGYSARINRALLRVCVLVTLFASGAEAAEPAVGNADSQPPILVQMVAPTYPEKALAERLEGNVIVAFDVDESGRTENPRVVASTVADVFDEAAIAAVRLAVYQPARKNGMVQRGTGLSFNVPFRLAKGETPSPSDRRRPTYPPSAVRKGVEGHCVLRYSLAPDGMVEKAAIVECVPPGHFEKPTLEAVLGWRFLPLPRDEGGQVKLDGLFATSFRLMKDEPASASWQTDFSARAVNKKQ